MTEPMFYQLFEKESCTYTYLLADPVTREAVLIDPVREMIERDLRLINELGLSLKCILDTHVHADHVTGAGDLRLRTGARTCISAAAHLACSDVPLAEGDVVTFGQHQILVFTTPGHTDTCLSYLCGDRLFTGDALLIRGCGRTDFQSGSSSRLFHSVTDKLFKLPEATQIFPGHDYRGHTRSTIGEEKAHNPRLRRGTTEQEFIAVMENLHLAVPSKIHEALPANLGCGISAPLVTLKSMDPTHANGFPEVTVAQVGKVRTRVTLLDVRRPDEFVGELGHIDGAILVTQGGDLDHWLQRGDRQDAIVFVCRSGRRSGQATISAVNQGYQHVANMIGGMLEWNRLKLPVVRTP
jgi:sulfur dioxygenase